jgi:hypothetical protein
MRLALENEGAFDQKCRGFGTYFTDRTLFENNLEDFCGDYEGVTMKRDRDRDSDTDYDSITVIYQAPERPRAEGDLEDIYQYDIHWISDCPLATSQTITDCMELMRGNYYGCNNGGKGGSIRVGCLLYAYRPNKLQEPV